MGLFGKKKNETEKTKTKSKVTLSDGTIHIVAQKVDCIGDSCPRPQLMTKKALNAASRGDVIEILVDNPSSMEAIPPMMNDLDTSHLETIKAERYWEIYVRKD
jgi:tRNA 2-thiouridine synthesizing protein A